MLLCDADGHTFGESPCEGLRHASASLRKRLWTWADDGDIDEQPVHAEDRDTQSPHRLEGLNPPQQTFRHTGLNDCVRGGRYSSNSRCSMSVKAHLLPAAGGGRRPGNTPP
ncbi:hypothetical protein GCM10019016_013280 [Streptomyces prasinosporus]|uniref:Uncharacterized protein n=1 Tax=Streptomyces prasinosporus TaxID=68256 RepID=A0ABP6THG4_9ACTN|nr:hypothetical protein GCM10010332_72370 [Streptomyces albogriseolus]